jgi:hypothetical protein
MPADNDVRRVQVQEGVRFAYELGGMCAHLSSLVAYALTPHEIPKSSESNLGNSNQEQIKAESR